jgi:branched-chain amino acid transport system permease protein
MMNLVMVLLIFFPIFVRDRHLLHILIAIFVYVTLVQSWNLPGGYTGYTSFGHVLFFGIGGYTTAMLVVFLSVPTVITYLIAGILSSLVALIFGYISLRLKGPYFAIATLALATMGRYVFLNFEIFGGAEGVLMPMSPLSPDIEKIPYYYGALLVAALTTLTVYLITKTRLGLGLMAIRENEEKAAGAGINTTKHKVIAFIVSAFFPGVIGGLYASYLEYVNPDSCFSILYSANILLMAILGGIGTIAGPILGSAVVVILSEIFSVVIGHQGRLIVFGLLLTFMAIYLPGGLLSVKDKLGYGKKTVSFFDQNAKDE